MKWPIGAWIVSTLWLAACAAPQGPRAPTQQGSEDATAPSETPATSASPANAPGAAPAAPPAEGAPTPVPCGPFACLRFPTAAEAFDHVLHKDAPRVLGIGESHALAHHTVPSATARFTADLLPRLPQGGADVVVELLAPPSDCRTEAKEQARREERAITEGQAESNQNEFVALGHASRRVGIVPYILRATCQDVEAIAAAGDEGVLVIMETIARLTALEVERLLSRASPDKPRMVVAYGGALHNDPAPRPGRETWSYGPRVRELTGGHYTALDLIVPEHIGDSDSWRAQPWYDALPELDEQSAVLLELEPRNWVLFFPRTAAPAAASADESR